MLGGSFASTGLIMTRASAVFGVEVSDGSNSFAEYEPNQTSPRKFTASSPLPGAIVSRECSGLRPDRDHREGRRSLVVGVDVRPRIHAAGLALASDATLVVNVAHLFNTRDAGELLQHAIELGGELFIGVLLTSRESREIVRWISTSAAEVVGHVGARKLRRKRRAR